MADVKWIKITTDIFDDEKILLIESLPDANAIIVVWFKLLCLAGKMNNSGVFLMSNRIAYTDKMFATIFRMKESTVQLALQTFEQFGMVEIVDGVITIPNWDKHQSLDSYEKKKERDRLYARERRAAQRSLIEKSSDSKTTPSSDVAISDKEEEREERNREDNIYTPVIAYLNEKAGTSYRATTAKTQTVIRARVSEGFKLEDFQRVIDKKCAEWIGTEWEKFLRPETLFGTKFEGYLNAKEIKRTTYGANGIAINANAPNDLEGIF